LLYLGDGLSPVPASITCQSGCTASTLALITIRETLLSSTMRIVLLLSLLAILNHLDHQKTEEC
jgi:hypothetical protein